jgi:hypothetical protein
MNIHLSWWQAQGTQYDSARNNKIPLNIINSLTKKNKQRIPIRKFNKSEFHTAMLTRRLTLSQK